jgi:hypothetical protein
MKTFSIPYDILTNRHPDLLNDNFRGKQLQQQYHMALFTLHFVLEVLNNRDITKIIKRIIHIISLS